MANDNTLNIFRDSHYFVETEVFNSALDAVTQRMRQLKLTTKDLTKAQKKDLYNKMMMEELYKAQKLKPVKERTEKEKQFFKKGTMWYNSRYGAIEKKPKKIKYKRKKK